MDKPLFTLRTSVRAYQPRAVPEELIQELLQAAVEAPSGGNRQPWHFYVVRNEGMKKQLTANAWQQKFIQTAPVVIVVCAEPARSGEKYFERGETLYCIQDTAAAVENILLCAAQNGLGACWCGAFDEDGVRQAMALPAGQRPVAILPIGYPAGASKKPKRRPMKEVVTFLD